MGAVVVATALCGVAVGLTVGAVGGRVVGGTVANATGGGRCTVRCSAVPRT